MVFLERVGSASSASSASSVPGSAGECSVAGLARTGEASPDEWKRPEASGNIQADWPVNLFLARLRFLHHQPHPFQGPACVLLRIR